MARRLDEAGEATYRLDGDVLRRTLCSDLGFDAASRRENIRRAVESVEEASGLVLEAVLALDLSQALRRPAIPRS